MMYVLDNDSKAQRFSLFILLGMFYLMNTQISIPNGTILRWIVLFGFMIICLIHVRFRISWTGIKRSPIIGFAFIMVPSFIKLLSNSTMLFKALSIYVVFLCFVLLFQNASPKRCKQLLSWFTQFICFTVVLNAPLMFSNAFYLGGRFRGILKNANGCSCIAMMSFICALYEAYNNVNKRRRKTYVVIAIVSYLEIIFTQSRMGFAASTLALIFILILFSYKTSTYRFFSSISLTVIIAIIAYLIISRVNISVFDRLQNMESSRKAWKYASDLIRQAPIFGHGYGISAYHQDSIFDRVYWTFFSSYLELIVDAGYYGLVAFVLIMVRDIKRLINASHFDRSLLILLSFIVCCLLLGISESYMFSVGNPVTLYFWFVVILAENYCNKLVEEHYSYE